MKHKKIRNGKYRTKIYLLMSLIFLVIAFLIIFFYFNHNTIIKIYYCPQTDGYIASIPDENIHDNGASGGGDSLEIYCRKHVIRLCLSEEYCPWREDIFSNDKATCFGDYEDIPMVWSANVEGINLAKIVGTGDQRIENIYCLSDFKGFSPAWNIESLNSTNS